MDGPAANRRGRRLGAHRPGLRLAQTERAIVLECWRKAVGAPRLVIAAAGESRMVAEPITSPLTGARGWTITWRGRGWWQSFDDYLALVRDGVALGRSRGMPVIPSVKYHLPGPGQDEWQIGEYVDTTRALLEAWRRGGDSLPMPLENWKRTSRPHSPARTWPRPGPPCWAGCAGRPS